MYDEAEKEYSCYECSEGLDEDEVQWCDGDPYCQGCFEEYCSFPDFNTPEDWKKKVLSSGDLEYVQDRIYTINIPIGELGDKGKERILNHLMNSYKSDLDFNDFKDFDWVSAEGKGGKPSLAKRISKFMYEKYKIKIETPTLNIIGNTAVLHTNNQSQWYVMITRNLSRDSKWYANDGSCWWHQYKRGKEWFKESGGFALLEFKSPTSDWKTEEPISRAWVLPLIGDDADASLDVSGNINTEEYLLFNAYMSDSAQDKTTFARVFATMLGYNYNRVKINNETDMYINGGTGIHIFDNTKVVSPDSSCYLHIQE